MNKILTLFFCCIALIVSGMAQPKTGRISEKFAEKFKHEKSTTRINLEKEKLGFSQKQISLPKMQNPAKSQKSENWWELDTVYVYCIDGEDERHIFSYEKGKCTVNVVQTRKNNQWNDFVKYIYSYDSKYNMTEELCQMKQSGQWINGFRIANTFDSQNNMTFSIMQFWQSGQWANMFKSAYLYDSQNNVKEETGQYWSGQWFNTEKITHSYYSHNNLKESIYQDWGTGKWDNSWKDVYIYNTQNEKSEILGQFWENTQWNDVSLQTFYYDEQNQCTSYIYQVWENNEWLNEDKSIFSYDLQNNITTSVLQFWNGDTWENLGKWSCSFDENNNAISGFFQCWSENTWSNDDGALSVDYNNMQSFILVYGHRFTATYVKTGGVGIIENNLFNTSILLFPNPVSDILHIKTANIDAMPEIMLYSIQGALLATAKGNQIDVTFLPDGVYFVNIDGICRKIVKTSKF
jgi:hypothetical protein